jgi:integration host factor subunit alpha
MANHAKRHLIDAVYAGVGGLSKKEAVAAVEAVFDLMKEVLEHGEMLKIAGFGTFGLREKKERKGRNPQTGTPIAIPARRVVTFKASNLLKDRLSADTSGP